MKQIHLVLLISCLLGLGARTAKAQVAAPRGGPIGVAPYQGPAVSPYLNLTRRGSPPGVNLYGLVRPQIDFNTSIQQLQQEITANQVGIGAVESEATLPATGHPSGFMTQARYFNTVRTGPLATGSQVPAQTLPRSTPGLPRFISARGQTPPVVQP